MSFIPSLLCLLLLLYGSTANDTADQTCGAMDDDEACQPPPPDDIDPDDMDLTFGVKQSYASGAFAAEPSEIKVLIEATYQYMQEEVSEELFSMCKNKDEMCTVWAVAGECEKNPDYMKVECGPACFSCDFMTVEGRCPIDPNAPSAWEKGDLNKMFEKLTSEPYLTEYSVEILSSPKTTGGPWVVTMDDVVSETEAERLIELGAIEGYDRSTDVGALNADGTVQKVVSAGRTSTNAWCQNECFTDPTALAVVDRLCNLSGIDEINSEYLQLLKYEKGQKYNTHHDYIGLDLERQQGPRILTVYLYLNDVKAGGGTHFDQLDITVMPKRGRALLWPSVRNDDPSSKDHRTTHSALPVEAGKKYGANAWFHLHDFKTPNANGCQ